MFLKTFSRLFFFLWASSSLFFFCHLQDHDNARSPATATRPHFVLSRPEAVLVLYTDRHSAHASLRRCELLERWYSSDCPNQFLAGRISQACSTVIHGDHPIEMQKRLVERHTSADATVLTRINFLRIAIYRISFVELVGRRL